MAGRLPEEHVATPVAHQDWRDVTFLHWRFDPEVIAARLPAPLQPDVRDGSAWVGLTPFRIERFRPPLLPPVPGLSSFPETNLRTYAVGPDGTDGIWFLTLEVDSLPNVVGSRWLGVPYRWAAMEVAWDGGQVTYTSRRRGHEQVGYDITIEPGAPFAPDDLGELDHWLTGRWRSWARPFGKLAQMPVAHEPWPLRRAEVVKLDESLLASAGLTVPEEPPVVHFAAGVEARLGPPRLRSF